MKVLLAALLAAAGALGAGVALGALSWNLWVVGLPILVLGLVVGVALTGMLIATGDLGRARWSVRVSAIVAVAIGWAAIQVMDDGHMREAYRIDLARARAAASGLPPAELQKSLGTGDEAVDFLGRGADALLEKQVEAEVGAGGVVGRWWWRAESGVRLAGSYRESRGLPVGRAGALVWALAEMSLASALALVVVRRARRRLGAVAANRTAVVDQ